MPFLLFLKPIGSFFAGIFNWFVKNPMAFVAVVVLAALAFFWWDNGKLKHEIDSQSATITTQTHTIGDLTTRVQEEDQLRADMQKLQVERDGYVQQLTDLQAKNASILANIKNTVNTKTLKQIQATKGDVGLEAQINSIIQARLACIEGATHNPPVVCPADQGK